MKIVQQQVGHSSVLRPQGPIVGEDSQQLSAALSQVPGAPLELVVLDLTDVPFVDGRGLETLMEAAEARMRGGHMLHLAGVNETLREVLRLTGLDSLFEFESSHGQAEGAA